MSNVRNRFAGGHALNGAFRWIVLLALWMPGVICAQAWPAKAIKLVVPFPAGGATDHVARLFGERLSRRLGQPVVIENRTGAGANVGAEVAARAPNDGYTLLIAPTSIYAIAVTLYPRLSYDLMRDFAAISTLVNVPHVLVVNAQLPARDLRALIALARARPQGLSLASQGSGSVSHLEGEMLAKMAQIQLLHVPYRGSAPAVQDLVGGQVELMFDSITSSLPHIRSGRLRPIAVTSMARSKLLPEVPTMVEAGQNGYVTESWISLLAPKGTPEAVVRRLNQEVRAIVSDPDTQARFTELGLEGRASTPQECWRQFEAEVLKWRPLVKSSGARVD